MALSNVLPILVMFFVWGIKPGPHTTTLVFRSVSHGTRAGLAIAIGNNLCHLLYFWLAFWALNFFSAQSKGIIALRLIAAAYIICYSIYEMWHQKIAANISKKQNYLATILAGFVVGLMNPLNASFYLGVIPQLIGYRFHNEEIVVVSFLIFFALLSGQAPYIAFADVARTVIQDEKKRKRLIFFSNLVFSFIGIYIIIEVVFH